MIIEGTVKKGNKIGTKLGFPTANISLDHRCDITDGVYAARATTPYGTFDAMASAGTRATVTDSPSRWLEVNLFDFDHDLYGQTIKVELFDKIREQKKFGSVEQLRTQIELDKTNITTILTNLL